MQEQTFSLLFKGIKLDISSVLKKRNKEWIVCLHGIQSSKELFFDFLKQPFLKDYSLLAIDSIGFGASSKPEDFSYDILDQAKVLEILIQQLDIEKLNIVGHSLGGTIGTLMLQQLQDKILSFINLEGNLTLADSTVTKEVSRYSFEEFRNKEYAEIKDGVKNSKEVSAELRSRSLELIPDYAFYKTCLSIIHWAENDDLLHLFDQAMCKRLYVFGDQNKYKKDIAPNNVEKIEIPNAGHFMLLDNPQATYKAIEVFLNTL